ncbi:MAG: hypothetical protein AAF563_10560 [Pseudomonadota bacterium]
MTKMTALLAGALAMVVSAWAAPDAIADEEAANYTHVVASPWGRCYVRSVPASGYGSEGTTEVFVVGDMDQPDRKVATYDFFSLSFYLSCNVMGDDGVPDVAMVGLGPWARGHAPNDETVALALFYGGKEVARYSTLDIAGDNPDAVDCSVSHYQVLGPIYGYVRDGDERTVFQLTTLDGRTLSFDAVTGELVDSQEGNPPGFGYGACP